MPMIVDLRAFLMQCPFLQIPEDSIIPRMYVDYLSEHPMAYEIQIIPAAKVIRKYVDGGGIKQTDFVFRSIEYHDGRDVQQNMDALAFYERFSAWLEKTKPTIKDWIKVEAVTDGYLFEHSEGRDRAVYQIQCSIKYTFDGGI